jgi:hypothetical protein
METKDQDVTSTELAAAGKTGPRITREHIQSMMARVQYRTDVPEGTTTTFVHAFLNGTFFLASGFSACVDPANFVAAIGAQYATEDAMKKAENALWLLEGYKLYAQLNTPVVAGDINDLNAFAAGLEDWHVKMCERAEQMMEIPDGFVIEFNPGNGLPVQPLTLTGDVHTAFLAGITSGAGTFSKLPFAISIEDAPD